MRNVTYISSYTSKDNKKIIIVKYELLPKQINSDQDCSWHGG